MVRDKEEGEVRLDEDRRKCIAEGFNWNNS